jgi:drug/metabolite transporter (DMT)-like permease
VRRRHFAHAHQRHGVMSRERGGVLLCLLSAAAFSSSTIFGRIALEDGVGVLTLLALRYGGAVVLFWGLVAVARQPLPSREAALRVLALGAVLLAGQAALFYSALARLDAGLCVLLLYTFPAIVAVAAVAIGRERPSLRKAGAVLVATIGTAFVLLGDAQLRGDGLGIALGLASAVAAAAWVLVSDRLLQGIPSLVVSALVSTGAATALWVVGLATSAIDLTFGPVGWGAIVGTILISTVLAISTSMAGIARVGPTIASVLLTAEVPLAVTWATLLLGERLQLVQVVGGVLVVAAVLLLQAGRIRRPAWATARSTSR